MSVPSCSNGQPKCSQVCKYLIGVQFAVLTDDITSGLVGSGDLCHEGCVFAVVYCLVVL